MSKPSIKKPKWLKVSGFTSEKYTEINRLLSRNGINTVCHAANCPNRGTCFSRGTATFLILGPTCTRNCGFCDVTTGRPDPLDQTEPLRVARAAAELNLKHVVVTSVTRDDLPDGGAAQFVKVVEEIRRLLPRATVELLTPDFKLSPESIEPIISVAPDIFNHNLETVSRLYPTVRPQADYNGSLRLLKHVADRSSIRTKSGLIVGLGETREELRSTFADLARHNVSILTIGQYLSPGPEHLEVQRFLTPEEFDEMADEAKSAGIPRVFSAPLVRSSYMADMAL